MSVINDVATALATTIDAVPDSGVVYSVTKLPSRNEWRAFVDSFTSTIGGERVIRAWVLQYLGETRRESTVAVGATKQLREIRYAARYYHGWYQADNSEAAFRDMVEAVADSIDANRSLGGFALDHDPVDIDVPNDGSGVFLGDHLCHYAVINITVQVEATYTTS